MVTDMDDRIREALSALDQANARADAWKQRCAYAESERDAAEKALREGDWYKGEVGVVVSRHHVRCVLCRAIVERAVVDVDKVPLRHRAWCYSNRPDDVTGNEPDRP